MSDLPIDPDDFAQIYLDFSRQLPDQLKEIDTAWEQCQRHAEDIEQFHAMRKLLHTLVGASLSLGMARVGAAAREAETLVLEVCGCAPTSSGYKAVLMKAIAESLKALRQAAQIDHQEGDGTLNARMSKAITAVQSLQDARSRRLIYLVEDDPIQAQELASQIGFFGYTVQVFNQLCNMQAASKSILPTAVLMDVIFPEGELAGIEVIAELQKTFRGLFPVIFISASDSFAARLQAVRAGGSAYFVKPVDAGALVDALDRLTGQESPLPYRVLIVDDSRVQANFYAMHMMRAGIVTEILTDPTQALHTLREFNPDLILLDMYMPDCTGMELAQVIRQVEAYLSVPIVYLSSETDRGKQMEALGLGADDFLAKPIKPAYLISAVASRVERYRKLRTLMLCDSLTGLLNHTTIKERLAQEVARASRQNSHLAYVMLDLDFFKGVNDTYGHAAGDRVLKSLSQLLSQRLRGMDIIGRYGGEEFAIILPNATGPEAVQIIEDLRSRFANLHHRAGEHEFSVTFSAGIASYPDCQTLSALSAAADRALYLAKGKGRNQVVCADSV
jgi:diguanylate cyclase (GGDEF)-like protein